MIKIKYYDLIYEISTVAKYYAFDLIYIRFIAAVLTTPWILACSAKSNILMSTLGSDKPKASPYFLAARRKVIHV